MELVVVGDVGYVGDVADEGEVRLGERLERICR